VQLKILPDPFSGMASHLVLIKTTAD